MTGLLKAKALRFHFPQPQPSPKRQPNPDTPTRLLKAEVLFNNSLSLNLLRKGSQTLIHQHDYSRLRLFISTPLNLNLLLNPFVDIFKPCRTAVA